MGGWWGRRWGGCWDLPDHRERTAEKSNFRKWDTNGFVLLGSGGYITWPTYVILDLSYGLREVLSRFPPRILSCAFWTNPDTCDSFPQEGTLATQLYLSQIGMVSCVRFLAKRIAPCVGKRLAPRGRFPITHHTIIHSL